MLKDDLLDKEAIIMLVVASPIPGHHNSGLRYPKYGPQLCLLYKEQCNTTLRDYNTAYFASQGSLEASKLLSIYFQHKACVYDGLSTDEQLNF